MDGRGASTWYTGPVQPSTLHFDTDPLYLWWRPPFRRPSCVGWARVYPATRCDSRGTALPSCGWCEAGAPVSRMVSSPPSPPQESSWTTPSWNKTYVKSYIFYSASHFEFSVNPSDRENFGLLHENLYFQITKGPFALDDNDVFFVIFSCRHVVTRQPISKAVLTLSPKTPSSWNSLLFSDTYS